jgi:hypothetical protein
VRYSFSSLICASASPLANLQHFEGQDSDVGKQEDSASNIVFAMDTYCCANEPRVGRARGTDDLWFRDARSWPEAAVWAGIRDLPRFRYLT